MKEQILQTLVPVLGTILTALIGWLGAKLVAFIQAKTKNEYLQGALTRAEHAVQTAVLEVQAAYVDAIKEASADGTLTTEEAKAAKDKAVAAAKSYLGMKGLALLSEVFGFTGDAIDKFLGGRVEAAVAAQKPAEAT